MGESLTPHPMGTFPSPGTSLSSKNLACRGKAWGGISKLTRGISGALPPSWMPASPPMTDSPLLRLADVLTIAPEERGKEEAMFQGCVTLAVIPFKCSVLRP